MQFSGQGLLVSLINDVNKTVNVYFPSTPERGGDEIAEHKFIPV